MPGNDDAPPKQRELVNIHIARPKLGEGGMNSVYTAAHPSIGKRVALKVRTWLAERERAPLRSIRRSGSYAVPTMHLRCGEAGAAVDQRLTPIEGTLESSLIDLIRSTDIVMECCRTVRPYTFVRLCQDSQVRGD